MTNGVQVKTAGIHLCLV